MPAQTKRLRSETERKANSIHKSIPLNRPDERAIAVLAYELWQARGCPEGSPEQDWFQAEQQLQNSTRVNAQSL